MDKSPTLRVLVVDDDIDFTRLLADSLVVASEHNCEITIAHAYEEAIEMLQLRRFDFAIVDCFLGGAKSGLAFLREIEDAGSRIPVLILTAVAREPLISHALELGAVAVVSKSRWDVHKLLELVEDGSATLSARRSRNERLAS